jgi:hypothetical protein
MSSWQPPSGQSASPYFSPPLSPYDPPPRKPVPKALWWALGGGGALLLLLCCCSCGGLFMFGMNIAEEEIAVQLRDNPKFREHIGELESIEIDMIASSAQNDAEVFVYRVRGNKGSGRLTVREGSDAEWNTTIERADLRLPDGAQVQILP